MAKLQTRRSVGINRRVSELITLRAGNFGISRSEYIERLVDIENELENFEPYPLGARPLIPRNPRILFLRKWEGTPPCPKCKAIINSPCIHPCGRVAVIPHRARQRIKRWNEAPACKKCKAKYGEPCYYSSGRERNDPHRVRQRAININKSIQTMGTKEFVAPQEQDIDPNDYIPIDELLESPNVQIAKYLKFVEGSNSQEIGEGLGIPTGVARNRLQVSLLRLTRRGILARTKERHMYSRVKGSSENIYSLTLFGKHWLQLRLLGVKV